MPRKDVVALANAYDKMKSDTGWRKESKHIDMNVFAIGFTSDDVQMTTRDGKVNVTAKLSKKDFDKIIYSNGSYILDYFKELGLIK